jgi:hypothetical protein
MKYCLLILLIIVILFVSIKSKFLETFDISDNIYSSDLLPNFDFGSWSWPEFGSWSWPEFGSGSGSDSATESGSESGSGTISEITTMVTNPHFLINSIAFILFVVLAILVIKIAQ